VSSGPSSVTVLNVVGDTESQAMTTLQGQGLVASPTCQPTGDPSENGIVSAQNPVGGATAPPGSTVIITVDSISGCSATTTTTSTP
jgi:beta-lactam-binding protein with PASTA domain